MKRTALSLSLAAVALAASGARAETPEDRLQALEARITQLEGELARPAPAAADDKVKINGFMSAGVAWLDDDTLAYDAGTVSDDVSYRADATVGLQFDMRVNDRVNAVTQFRVEGITDYDPGITWAYIGYRPTEQDEIRIGRQRLPFFMLSEYLDVGYAYPWAKPPVEVYGTQTPSSYEGISWTRTFATGDWSHEVQALFGATDFSITGTSYETDDDLGINWLGTVGDLTLRAGYATGRATVSAPSLEALGMAPIEDDYADFWGVGVQYDDGQFVVLSEYTSTTTKGYFPDSDSAYLTVGWRTGKFLPTVTWSSLWVNDESERNNAILPLLCPGVVCVDDPPGAPGTGAIPFPANTVNRILDAEQTAITLGLRYDFLPNASLKLDASRVIDTEDSWGTTSPVDGNGNGTSFDELLFGKPDTPFTAYRLVVDVVF